MTRLFSSGKSHAVVSESDLSALAAKMVQAVTDDERETAARSSFRYLWTSATSAVEDKSLQVQYAKQMAMRHLESKKGNYDVALGKFRNAIKFRQDMDVDGLCLCFHADDLPNLDDETKARYATYREKLQGRMGAGRVFVMGHDKCGRAIYTIYAARTKDFDPEWFLKESLYNFERALACTERQSEGREQTITVIGNYTGFKSQQHAAPMSLSHEFMDKLRQNYPGRVKRVYLLNTPTSFLLFWSILKPFIGTETRKKIQFVNSERQKKQAFSDLVDLEEATPWMLEGGKKSKEFDVQLYLNHTRFDHGFDS
mmetsp:Transcript_1194/g.2814  ORF Transcript_1194/g.2814 Transcript_1194/m.2814 type:complete len:312 (+) Transcript_1194:396-1331(+)|eukprot:CAMPEP_0119550638 /NCGR_PEP_ID=MMETSP1352-20130426/4111_1 /TAXON_ID=265584 /ORGANISM="Stauroneis constricta, Strain CCMP1120" /LENGTH=311 /DNA_ID=CAMNT_0007596543 /DNA_START=376 /DNA_END=1311 /DNA_ORIENTATION=+